MVFLRKLLDRFCYMGLLKNGVYEVEHTKVKLARYEKALLFYAEELNYCQTCGFCCYEPDVFEGCEQARVIVDNGEMARQALKE